MKTLILTITGVMIATMAVTAGPVSAATSNGPYYPTPARDQQLPASTRFGVRSNWGGAPVLDQETGLVWEQSPSTSGTWEEAQVRCNVLATGGSRAR